MFRRLAARTLNNSRRFFGGHAHDSHGPAEQHLFGRKPGSPKEGWEYITYITLASSGLVFFIGTLNPESFRDWARREYLARRQILENGGTVEFGKWYQSGYQHDQVDNMPTEKSD